MVTTAKPAIAYILKGYPRISETFISNEILRLEQLGFTILIFPMRQPREDFCHDSVKQIQAEVHYLPTYLFKDFFRLSIPNLLLALKNPRVYLSTISIAMKRFARTKKAATFKHLFQAGYMVYNYISKNPQVAHLHGHFAHSPTSVTMFASLLSGIPFSFTAHAKDIYTSNTEQLREKINKASFVVTCTRYNENYLKGISSSIATPIYCNYHGIDTSLFNSSGAEAICTPPFTLLTVARITEKKGLPTIYRALAILKERGLKFTHSLIGDGDDKEAIRLLIKELALEENCCLLGTYPHEEVLQHFRKSDLFLLGCEIAKNGDRDGIPNVLVESLAMGVPAISTEVSAIPELIQHQQTGLLVSPGSSTDMADAIHQLLTDHNLRKEIIERGQSFVRSSFDNKKLSKDLANIFERHVEGIAPKKI